MNNLNPQNQHEIPHVRKVFGRRTLFAIAGVMLLALPFWVLTVFFGEQQSAITKNSIQATAKITAKTAAAVRRSAGSKFGTQLSGTDYSITYQFPVTKNGKPAGTFRHQKRLRRDDFKNVGIGGTLTIRYEHHNPKNHIVTYLEKDNGSETSLTIALILTVVAAGIAGASMFKYIFYSSSPH